MASGTIIAKPEFITKYKSISGQTVAANEPKAFEIDIAESGYTPIGIVSVKPEYPMSLALYFFGITDETNVAIVKFKNTVNSAVGSFSIGIDVLYRRSD